MTSKYKKLLISKRRIGILKNYLNKVKIVRVCDFIIFEIPILTVAEIPILTVAESMVNYIYHFNSQNRDLKYNKITNSHYLHLV